MNNREMYEFAAKAAGMEITVIEDDSALSGFRYETDEGAPWAPSDDLEQAMEILIESGISMCVSGRSIELQHELATRHANFGSAFNIAGQIVYFAALIGRAKWPPKSA